MLKWQKISCLSEELNLSVTLMAGQSFRWQKKEDNTYQGVMSDYLWSLKQTDEALLYHVHNVSVPEKLQKSKEDFESDTSSVNYEEILKDYFQLHIKLAELYPKWAKIDSNFAKVSATFSGIRILRQDPVENLISFICSANNNIPRITCMVEKLCQNYGEEICQKDGQSFYSFPKLEALAEDRIESELRTLNFGYRAKYINQCAKYILKNHPPGWLESLRMLPYEEVHSALMGLPGVGAKVADCVCLMSLDKPDAVPVDTHIWQITVRDYQPHLKTTKSLTDRTYQQIGNFYRQRFGEYAGWANTVLFAADLRQFKNHHLPKNT